MKKITENPEEVKIPNWLDKNNFKEIFNYDWQQ